MLLLPCHFSINFKMYNLNQQGDLLSPHHVVWLTKLEKCITCSVKGARTARAKWSCLGLTSHRRQILWKNCYWYTRWKVVNGKEGVQFLQAPVASLWTLFSFSTVKVRFLTPLNITACLFLSLQFLLITLCGTSSLFSNMHPASITVYFNSPIHNFLCIIPSGGFHILHLLSCAGAEYSVLSSNIMEGK